MKRLTAVVGSIASLASLPAGAQRLSSGIVLGAVRSTVESGPIDFDHRAGATAGVRVGYAMTPSASVQVELTATQRGAALSPGPWRMRLTYAELAGLGRFIPRMRGPMAPLVLGGVAVARELSCGGRTYDPLVDPLPGSLPPVVDLDCDGMRSRKLDVSLVAGAGLVWHAGRREWTIDLRSTRGRDLLSLPGSDVNFANRAVEVRVGVSR